MKFFSVILGMISGTIGVLLLMNIIKMNRILAIVVILVSIINIIIAFYPNNKNQKDE